MNETNVDRIGAAIYRFLVREIVSGRLVAQRKMSLKQIVRYVEDNLNRVDLTDERKKEILKESELNEGVSNSPSSRAKKVGISTGTVAKPTELLIAQGYLDRQSLDDSPFVTAITFDDLPKKLVVRDAIDKIVARTLVTTRNRDAWGTGVKVPITNRSKWTKDLIAPERLIKIIEAQAACLAQMEKAFSKSKRCDEGLVELRIDFLIADVDMHIELGKLAGLGFLENLLHHVHSVPSRAFDFKALEDDPKHAINTLALVMDAHVGIVKAISNGILSNYKTPDAIVATDKAVQRHLANNLTFWFNDKVTASELGAMVHLLKDTESDANTHFLTPQFEKAASDALRRGENVMIVLSGDEPVTKLVKSRVSPHSKKQSTPGKKRS